MSYVLIQVYSKLLLTREEKETTKYLGIKQYGPLGPNNPDGKGPRLDLYHLWLPQLLASKSKDADLVFAIIQTAGKE